MNISGKRIYEARMSNGLTQADLAAAMTVDFNIDIDRSDISEIERGVRGVKDYELNAISLLLDVSLTFLLRGEES